MSTRPLSRARHFATGLGLVFAASALAPPSAAGQPSPGDVPRPAVPRPTVPPATPTKPAPDAPSAPPGPRKPIPRIPLRVPDVVKQPEPSPSPAPPPGTPGASRWTEPTADEMLTRGLERAGAQTTDALAGLLVGAALRDRASSDRLPRGLAALAKRGGPMGHEARMLSFALAPSAFGSAWTGWANAGFDARPQSTGVVSALAVLGPFRDNGGGLERREGPESEGSSYADVGADHSWGAYQVRWRRALVETARPSGLPLDLYVSPRAESCTYVASRVSFPKGPERVVARVAASGAVRLVFDGATVAQSDEVHARGLVDRLAVSLPQSPGEHLVAVKVCSGSMADEGRVRIRFTDEAGAPVLVAASSDLSTLLPERAIARAPAPAARPGAAPKKPAAKDAAQATRRLPTLLEAALDPGPKPSRHAALAAAVVRSLAGADDLRSPRAPGLLDRVAQDPEASPDELAMAGWVSSFGANKSGWLNLAVERGRKSADPATVSFALRQLAEAQLSSSRHDWALATLAEAPLSGETDHEARLLRAQVRARSGTTSAQLEALTELLSIEAGLRQRSPVALLAELRNVASQRPEAMLGYQRRLAAVSAQGRDLRYAQASALEGAAAYERAAAALLTHQTDARALVELGRELSKLHRHAWARELLYTATRLSPNLPEAWEALAAAREAVMAEERAAGVALTDDPSHAARARQRALDLRPSDPRTKLEIGFRAKDASTANAPLSRAQPDERFLESSRVILDRVAARPAERGKVFERQPHFQRVVTYHPDQRVSQLIHYAREIVVEPRTQGELVERDIPTEGDQVELVFARLHRKDGTTVPPEEQSAAGAYVKWPQLREGDVVEIAVRSWTSGPVGRRGDAPFYFIDYVGSSVTRPVLFNEVVVDAPVGAQLGLDVIGGRPDRVVDQTVDGRRVQRFVWDAPPNLPDEPLSPRPTEMLPLVVGSTYRSWHEFREWYREAVKGFTEPDEQVRRLAAELTKGKKTEREKLAALFEFVADDIRYVNYVSGEWWLPNRPQQCLARRQGDCDDKAMLLIALLKSIGVEATPVLVQTRMTGMPSVLSSTKAAIPMFDHGIAYLPGKNGQPGTWLDATSPQSRLGPLPAMDARARALFVEQGEAKIVETPSSSPEEHGVTLVWSVELDASGAGKVRGEERHLGDSGFHLRNNLIEVDARAQWVEQYLSSRWLPTVELEGDIRYVPNEGKLGYVATSASFARREGRELALPVFGSFSFSASLAPLTKRSLPVVLPPQLAPSHQRRSMTITAPAGFDFAELPPGGEAKGGAFGSAKLAFTRGKTARSVVVEASIVFDDSTIEVAEYPAFRAWLQSADALFRQNLRLVPSTKPAAAPAR